MRRARAQPEHRPARFLRRDGLVKARWSEGDVMDTLPRPSPRGSDTPGAADAFAVFVEVRCVLGMELDDVPRPDPVVIDVPLHRRLEVTDDDPDLIVSV